MVYTKEKLLNLVVERTFANYLLQPSDLMNHSGRRTREKLMLQTQAALDVIFPGKEEISEEEFLAELPFLGDTYWIYEWTPDRLAWNKKTLDAMVALASKMNVLIKSDAATKLEKRDFYNYKKEMISVLLDMRSDVFTDEQFQVRSSDNEEFMLYEVTVSDGTKYFFHQPWRNVKKHYRPYEYKRMKENAVEYTHPDTITKDVTSEEIETTLCKFFLALNCARLRIYREYYRKDDNCPDEHWREIAREIY